MAEVLEIQRSRNLLETLLEDQEIYPHRFQAILMFFGDFRFFACVHRHGRRRSPTHFKLPPDVDLDYIYNIQLLSGRCDQIKGNVSHRTVF